jgi:hypothetical protein
MSTQKRLPRAVITLSLLFSALLLAACGSPAIGAGGTPTPPVRTDGTPIPLGPNNLLGKTPAQIAAYAQTYVQNDARIVSGTPQVLLVRAINPDQGPALGIGCIPNHVTIEDPPLVLVILKGNFELHLPGGRPTDVQYIGYVFDVWAGGASVTRGSKNGGIFRAALNDPSLPPEYAGPPQICPTPDPDSRWHYGASAPVPGTYVKSWEAVPTHPWRTPTPGPTFTAGPVASPVPTGAPATLAP